MKVFKDLYQYRELLKTSVKKEVRGRYKNSFFGVLWSFLNPLLQIAVYAIIFPIILKNNIENYVVFLCAGLLPWTFFTAAVSQSSFIFISNTNIVKKVYFPREILPISVVTSSLINFLISVIIVIALSLVYGMGLSWYLVFFPIIVIVQYIFQLGISFIVSAITVYFRDIEHFIGIALQVLFYATPIVYDAATIPGSFQIIMKLNPMAYFITAYRSIFYYHTMPDWGGILLMLALSIVLIVVGYLIFRKLQKGFAEEL
ncbi:MAG: ABC transporter permease [Clostridia bacterium]|nr:ABC transporter permease [Clostridia bacterium]